MKKVLLILTVLLSASAYANSAKIVATDVDDKTVEIALDSDNTPRINGDTGTYPTIKDFGDDSDYVNYCYRGTRKDTKGLLRALVNAADGDGDSWAKLKSIKANRKGKFTVVVLITDESGEHEEVYEFSPCK